jgi:hypothetical protein
MIKTKSLILLVFYLVVESSLIYGQETKSDINNTKDSLITLKNSLQGEMKKLKYELDSLKKSLASFDDKISLKRQELMILRYGKENGERISKGQVWKGMTDRMLRDSYGEPDKIDKNVEKWGVFTQWYYGDITFFFRDGVLTDWEEKEQN